MPSWFRRSASQAVEERRAAVFDTSHLETGIGRRTANSAAITMVSSAIIFGVQIAQLAILSRLLSPEDFGLVGMAVVATGFVRLFADIGLSTATIQRDEIDQKFVTAVFYIDLLVAFGLMLLCFAIAPLSAEIFSEPRVTMLIVAIALTFPLVPLRGQHQALLARRMLFVRVNATKVIANLCGATAAILAAWLWQFGYWSIVLGIVVQDVALVLLSWIALPWMPSRPGSLAAGRSAIGFGVNLLGANLAGWLWKQADRALIGWRWDASELGYYTRAYSVLMVPLNLVSGPLGTAVIPALSRLQNKHEEWTGLMQTSARAMAFFAGLLTLVLALNANFIIELLLGPEWSYSATIFVLLALSLYPSFIWEHARFVFISLGRTDTMRNYAFGAAIAHVAAFAAGVQWGAVGVAASLAIASVVVTPALAYIVARISRCSVMTIAAQFAPSFLAMVIVGGVYLAIQFEPQGGGSFAGAVGKSIAITLGYCAIHLAILPFSKGWREDAIRLRHLARGLSWGKGQA
ncbi:lipopolysaccharide biosynthesis protein [Erythrobacter sp. THAF29]|uniref:lipopolysaccharide biosynthesis protein n=1 Tax=Erythrobacter sp. THAF29 TaxID=2587851 RepID=UPI0012678473|nr:lipopolysaccharide biosynthesis protein [Erythrobacter sp. THAF29]QFT76317.1 Teichuronic acid biosynthesis protein TuaB [Erythrobacter sp. THAF29]